VYICIALGIQHAVWIYSTFPRYLLNGTILGNNVVEYIKCVFIFSTTSVWKISHSKKNSASYKNKHRLSRIEFRTQNILSCTQNIRYKNTGVVAIFDAGAASSAEELSLVW